MKKPITGYFRRRTLGSFRINATIVEIQNTLTRMSGKIRTDINGKILRSSIEGLTLNSLLRDIDNNIREKHIFKCAKRVDVYWVTKNYVYGALAVNEIFSNTLPDLT